MEALFNRKCVFMIGPPLAGKSAYVAAHKDLICRDPVVITSEDSVGLYDPSVFVQFSQAIRHNRDIIIDLTNLTEHNRLRFLNQLPRDYEAIATIVEVPYAILFERVRQGWRQQHTPYTVRTVKRMIQLYEAPSFDDFDWILAVGEHVPQC